ncbi:MAG: hypothetical protein J7K04_14015 [Spirochaetales bacterium]|nr:hypothetical protein [Spirochaetales bacterium]
MKENRDYHRIEKHANRHHKKSAEASIISGAVFTLAFGIVWFTTKEWFWVFPTLFAGLLPAVKGLQRFISERAGRNKVPDEAVAEKVVLRLAKDQNGIITPAMIAISTELTIEQAEKMLEKLAGKGYASMQVTEDGRVQYEFPEFIRGIDN